MALSVTEHRASADGQLTAVQAKPVLRVADRALLLLVLGELIVLYAPTVRWLIGRWTMSVWHNAHGMAIPPLVAYFIWQELRRSRHLPTASSPLGFLILIPALALHSLDAGMNTQLLSAVSLVLLLPGLSLLFLGAERTKAISFPLAFAALMLPIPLAVTERVQLALRELATVSAGAIVPALGIPVYVEETTLHLSQASLVVGDACSGFSTLYAAVAVAALTAYAADGFWKRLAVIVAAPPIAVGANILRVVLITVLVNWRGANVLGTWLHPATGVLTFVIALPIIFWLGQPRGAISVAKS